MKKICAVLLLIFASFAVSAPGFAQQKDEANCKDHPLINRLPGYWISECEAKQFDAYKFMTGKNKTTPVEGVYTYIRYRPPANQTAKPSVLQILRNMETAIKRVGGVVVATSDSTETLKITKDGKEIWIEVWADWTGKYILKIVEKAAMNQELVANADAFAEGLKTTGHIAVQGIFFDTGKTELKPESEAAISEVVKLLKADAKLKLFVVGHTDNAGAIDANMKLSQGRAQSVVQALVKAGIAAARLKAYGSGPYAPVASNDTEEGRAQNRRVELVKQ